MSEEEYETWELMFASQETCYVYKTEDGFVKFKDIKIIERG